MEESAKEKEAAMNDTTVAWTWRRVKLPRMMDWRVAGLSSWPILAEVPRRAERFISRFPLRLRTTGMIMMATPFNKFKVWYHRGFGRFSKGICLLDRLTMF